jgi:SAM-dependent methyltransferase
MTGRRRLGAAPPAAPLTLPAPAVVIWHDVECGGYTADLPLWRELARAADGPILDVGAGTGRVALHLARAGHAVVALDREPVLLEALAERARTEGLDVPAVAADAVAFNLGNARFALIVVPMQTVQLLPGRAARASFLAAARRHLRPGGRLALALADALEGFDEAAGLPLPDLGDRDGWRFVSQPVAVRAVEGGVRIERVRQAVSPDLVRTTEQDAVELAALGVEELEAEGLAAGLRPEPSRPVPATDEHVGSEVVVLRA